MHGLPFRILGLAIITGLGGCATGHGAAFNAASASQAGRTVDDPQSSLQSGGVNGLAGGGRSAAGARGGHGRTLYASGNVRLSGQGSAAGGTISTSTRLSGSSASTRLQAAGLKLAVGVDPLGGQSAKVKAGGGSLSVDASLGGLGKGGPVLGRKGAASGVLSGAGKTAGSLIGSQSKGADAGVGGVVGGLVGGKHKKPGLGL